MFKRSEQRGNYRRIRILSVLSVGYVLLAGWIFISLIMGSYNQIRYEYSSGLESLKYSNMIRVDLVELRYHISGALERNTLDLETARAIQQLDEGVRNKIVYTRSKRLSRDNVECLKRLYEKYVVYQERWREVRPYLNLGYSVQPAQREGFGTDEAALLEELSVFENGINRDVKGLEAKGLQIIHIGIGVFMLLILLLCALLIGFSVRLQTEARKSVAMVEEKLNRFLMRSGSDPIELGVENEMARIGDAIDSLMGIQEQVGHRERLSTLGQMAGGIAHNLKTPLMAMGAQVAVLKRRIADMNRVAEVHPELVAGMVGGLEQLVVKIPPLLEYSDHIVDALLRQTRATDGRTEETFTCRQLVAQLKILLDYEVKKCQGTLMFSNRMPEPFRVKGALDALVQVLSNLIVNALQSYDGAGGDVSVELLPWNGGVQIVVRDWGCGIPETVRNRMMSEVVTTKGSGGTGLGLYISNLIIKASFNGIIIIDSEEGVGTTVWVRIPGDSGMSERMGDA